MYPSMHLEKKKKKDFSILNTRQMISDIFQDSRVFRNFLDFEALPVQHGLYRHRQLYRQVSDIIQYHRSRKKGLKVLLKCPTGTV